MSGLYGYLVARGDTPVRANPVPRGLMIRRQGGTVRSRTAPLVRVPRALPRILSPAEADRLVGALRSCGGERRRRSAACSVPDSARRIVDQGRSSPGSRSLPFFDRSGSVHAERLKQQGRLFPLFIFEMLTSTRRLRVSGFFVALTQRTHSQRAIGVISFHWSWIFFGA
ncbi:MAG TPA: hypothetical protein VF940_05185, partial [Streptosporangiaceae bacterium]